MENQSDGPTKGVSNWTNFTKAVPASKTNYLFAHFLMERRLPVQKSSCQAACRYRPPGIISKSYLKILTNNQLAISHEMVVVSTRFVWKELPKQTWASPDRITFIQIDHMQTERRHLPAFMNIRTYSRPNTNSDHFLLVIVLWARITTLLRIPPDKRWESILKSCITKPSVTLIYEGMDAILNAINRPPGMQYRQMIFTTT